MKSDYSRVRTISGKRNETPRNSTTLGSYLSSENFWVLRHGLLRVARAATGRDHIIVMQGGYNGWHNDVACNLMTPLSALGPRVAGDEYPFRPISAGIPAAHSELVHPVNFNDLESVRRVSEKYPIAGLITEP